MKIAIIRKKYTFHGGAEGFSSSLIENLANEGHEIHVYAIKWHAGKSHENIYFHKVPAITSISFLRDLTFAVSTLIQLKRRRDFFDIIQTHDKTLFQDIYRAGDGCHIEWLKQRWKRLGPAGKASIVLNPYHWLILTLERIIMKQRRFNKIIAISELVKNNIIDNYGVLSKDIEVIYNGVDTDKFHPDNKKKYRSEVRKKYGLEEEDFVAVFVGSGFERKGVKYLIEAVESISEKVSLLIVGKGPAGKFQKKTGHQKIVFCGPQKDIHKYYAASDIFVFPTIYEPFGNVHLEALASGLPVITTKNSGASEIIRDGIHGFVVPEPEDSSAIAEKIRALSEDKDKLDSMSKNARALAEGFTFADHLGKIRALYKNIVAARSD